MNREVGVSLLAISLSAPFTFPSQPLQTNSRKAWEVNKSHSSPHFWILEKKSTPNISILHLDLIDLELSKVALATIENKN